MKVFIDTSAFIAYFIKQQEHHEEVLRKYNSYRDQKAIIITSDYVLDELFTWFNAKLPKSSLEKLFFTLKKIEERGQISILSIEKVIFKKGQEILLKLSEHRISFTDATTYVLYKDFAIDEIFTLDSNFKKMRLKTSF